ncbi:MAG TPA: arginine deiminase-related protein [Ignavibacteria bacterium]|nr:arginine deiminase-related protein [Ignavibacteria bacterium]HMR40879.1 arginine deiminase-related protein [Ignavibacteria bacterium]
MKPEKILMCKPEYFDVNYTGNEFMKDNIGKTDKHKAIEQWNSLKKVYEDLGFHTVLIEPVKDLVDMVFTANQSLPFIDKSGNKSVILSKMKNDQRKEEVKYFKDFYLKNDYKIVELPDDIRYFESMGDCVLDFERNILFGGYGFRTEEKTYDIIAKYVNFKIVKLKLINPVLYHLDTCMSVLNSDTAVIQESAFDEDGINKLREHFSNLIFTDENENLKYFVCNCHCPDGKNVIVQKGSIKFRENIKETGLNLIEVETGEFMRSGGSVFCMKLMIY